MSGPLGAECNACEHFVPARHDSGRINKKKYGTCLATVTWPAVPISYGLTWKPPEKRHVWWDTNAEECSHYAAPQRQKEE